MGLMTSNTGSLVQGGSENYWTGVLLNEVKSIQREKKVGIIECESLAQVKAIKEKGFIDSFFVYVRPPSIQDIEIRMIRNRFGQDTKETLQHKLKMIDLELKEVNTPASSLFDKIVVNDLRKKFLDRVVVHIMFNLYKRRL
mmetsp:Transcript_35632/g.54501  ORF Transcript_35632/g.54501 Transcript_35632/m.54501 type:complete len:141 (-) Transcript_35632:44-466(-)